MDKYHFEKKEEKPISLVLHSEIINEVLWGQTVEFSASELIKIFSIISFIKEKKLTDIEEIKNTAEDLFKEFNVEVFDYNMIFSNEVINHIKSSNEIDSLAIDFNDTPLIIRRNSSVESVVKEWEEKGINSDDAVEQRRTDEETKKEKIKADQLIIDTMFSDLTNLDFKNIATVMDWLYEYSTHYYSGVDIHKDELLKIFTQHGFSKEANDPTEVMLADLLHDKERKGKVIIGYMLMNLGFSEKMKDEILKWKSDN